MCEVWFIFAQTIGCDPGNSSLRMQETHYLFTLWVSSAVAVMCWEKVLGKADYQWAHAKLATKTSQRHRLEMSCHDHPCLQGIISLISLAWPFIAVLASVWEVCMKYVPQSDVIVNYHCFIITSENETLHSHWEITMDVMDTVKILKHSTELLHLYFILYIYYFSVCLF